MYFHVAMMNGQANQLSEMVPVAIIQSEIGRYIKAGATSYLLVNTSDIRPVAMTTRAVMEMAWGGVACPSPTDPDDARIYKHWATEEFGAKSADALAKRLQGLFCRASAAPVVRASGHYVRPATAPPPPPQLQQGSAPATAITITTPRCAAFFSTS